MPSYDPPEFYLHVGKAVREARKKKLTQAGLGTAVGLTRTSISNIEKGRQKLLLHTFFEIAENLDVEPAKLLPSSKNRSDVAPKLPADLAPQARAFIEAGIGIKKRR